MNPSPSRSWYTRLASRLLFPLHERLKQHHSTPLLEALEQSQWLAPEQLQQLQNQNLRQFIEHLQQHNPYYSALLAERGLDRDSFRTVADLAKLPLLTKTEIRAHQQQLLCDIDGKRIKYNTGGSSGEPLIFYMGMDRVSHDVAAKWRATRWWDVDIGDTEAVIWGSPIELGKQDRIKQWRDRLFRSYLIPAFDLRPERIRAYLEQLVRLRPKMVFGYPSVISQLALAAEQQQIPLSQLGVKVVFTTSEMLYQHQREQIERLFGAPVANGYGARDAGFIAHQCPQGSLHISSEHIVVEILDEQGSPCPPGQEGEIVVTHLATRGFPFVRYRTGDMGTLSDQPCSCGRGLPVLKEVKGRSTDFICATDGAKVHALALIYILREINGIEQFKIIQHQDDMTEVQIRTNSQFSQAALETISKAMQQRLGSDMKIRISEVEQFETGSNGKFRYVEDRRTPAPKVPEPATHASESTV
ncbi:phenylacetate--CoA ligase family protein [Motiliproteus sp.]|uniref:phenylacetate--CoA ligase family protein n=1 Tax=Motiliproteus sp. TaxID=1898955 RepID=UPI003BA9BD0E